MPPIMTREPRRCNTTVISIWGSHAPINSGLPGPSNPVYRDIHNGRMDQSRSRCLRNCPRQISPGGILGFRPPLSSPGSPGLFKGRQDCSSAGAARRRPRVQTTGPPFGQRVAPVNSLIFSDKRTNMRSARGRGRWHPYGRIPGPVSVCPISRGSGILPDSTTPNPRRERRRGRWRSSPSPETHPSVNPPPTRGRHAVGVHDVDLSWGDAGEVRVPSPERSPRSARMPSHPRTSARRLRHGFVHPPRCFSRGGMGAIESGRMPDPRLMGQILSIGAAARTSPASMPGPRGRRRPRPCGRLSRQGPSFC